MEAIIRHSPITRNGPVYSTYRNSPFPVAVYRTCCAKGSKAQSTVTHADPTHSDSGSSGTSRCVERGARQGYEAIRAGSALICCTSCGASSWSSARSSSPSPLGPSSSALLLLSGPPASLSSFLPAWPCSCLESCASSYPFSPSYAFLRCAFFPLAGHKERVKHAQRRQGQCEGQRARRAKHIGRFRQAPGTDTKTNHRRPEHAEHVPFRVHRGQNPKMMQQGSCRR